MSYCSKMATTMLKEDYEKLKEVYESLDDKTPLTIFKKGKVFEKNEENIPTVTIMWDWIPIDFARDDEWDGILLDYLLGVYDNDKKKPYKILIIGQELNDLEEMENDNIEVDELGRYIPNEAIPRIVRDFAF